MHARIQCGYRRIDQLSRMAGQVFFIASWTMFMAGGLSSDVLGREPRVERGNRRSSDCVLALLDDGQVAKQIVTIQTQQSSVLSSPQGSTTGVGQESKPSQVMPVNFETNPDVQNLLSPEKFEQIWKKYSAETPKQETWLLNNADQDARLICTGKPYGYLRTKQKFSKFHLKFEWRYPEGENGNSGVLLFSQDEDMIWPQALQVQLQHNKAGHVVPIGGAKSDVDLQIQQSAFLPNQWNECVISSADGTVTVIVNGVKQREVRGCVPASGHIGLQSEGSPVQFRKILLIGDPDVVQEKSGTAEGVVKDEVTAGKGGSES
ncbi:3-keto-disaccharide hydrolase [Lacunimicrobium album]